MNSRSFISFAGLLAALLCLGTGSMAAQNAEKTTPAPTVWRAGTVVTPAEVEARGADRCFSISVLSDEVFARMNRSFVPNPHITRTDLRYITLLHYDLAGRVLVGEMVCNKRIAADLVEIFRKLYEGRYPIERMVLIDEYGADDEASMRANNTSAFCYRKVAGSNRVSAHGLGMAVDINPLYNPYVKRRADGTLFIQPATAGKYADRNGSSGYMIRRGDLCHRLFMQHGFRWGGAWKSCKDYQHFEK